MSGQAVLPGEVGSLHRQGQQVWKAWSVPLQPSRPDQLEPCRQFKRPRYCNIPAAATLTAPEQVSSRPHSLTAEELVLRPEGEESQLPAFDPALGKVHLAVVGAGPSGLSVAERVAAAGFKVCIIDPAPLAPWTNNYGVWKDEFDAMGLEDCLSTVWQQAHVFLDSTVGGKK